MDKLPPNLLRAPDAYVDENVKKTFSDTGPGAITLWTQTGCALFIHSAAAETIALSKVKPTVNLCCEEHEGVPLIWLDLRFNDSGKGENLITFLDILDEGTVACLNALPYQSWIVVHWYDENINYCASSAAVWNMEERTRAQEALPWAREVLERTGGGDVEKARTKITSPGFLS